ncbi:MAG: DEAD/DEAH box helicase family protein [Candidatus Pacearchaeota archaeon]|nr:DEAD/DEAH box helicase family protein [Candidatus Pacearchaeota archaeon]
MDIKKIQDIIKTTPRDYQKAIFNTAKDNNTLVVLPTGTGKTLIALMLSVHRKMLFPSSKILFLAPTRPLIEQHLQYFKQNLPELFAEMTLFTGSINSEKRQKFWQTSEIIFSTPQCIANDLENHLYNLNDVSLLIIDEAHRCLKNYDYTKVVKFYKEHSKSQRILGLTASPGHEIEKVRQIAAHLNIDEIEIRTRESEDVKPYLKERDFKKIEIPFPPEFMEIQSLLKKLFDSKVSLLKEKGYIIPPINKITLLKLQNRLSSQISSGNFAAMHGVSLCAQAIKISHAIELLETQTLSGLNEYFKSLQEQAKQKKSRAVQTIIKSPEFSIVQTLLSKLIEKNIEHPKLDALAKIIDEEFANIENPKIIIFAQFRETVLSIIKKLSQNPKIKAKIFIGQAKKTISGLSQKEQKQIIDEFREGKINVLACTSIGEEGLDIPEVNSVIFYEPIPSAIRKIQRAGRTARLKPGKLIILLTKGTKDEIHHYASHAREKKMYKIIENLKEEIRNKSNLNKYLNK